jgi:very-short-patch-repair endonuclease
MSNKNHPNSPPAKRESAEGERKSVLHVNNLPFLRTFRKELRNHLTPAEAKLWTLLKKSQLDGRKFRRQHSVGNYILDFYCPGERLAIELDGAVHNTESAQEYDRERDLFLNYFGIKVLRFENKLVFQQAEVVLMEIKKNFGWLKETTPPLRGTPPSSRRGVV